MLTRLIASMVLAVLLSAPTNAAFELMVAETGNTPAGVTSFDTGFALATPISLDLFLVETTNVGFDVQIASVALTQGGAPPSVGPSPVIGPLWSPPSTFGTSGLGSSATFSGGVLTFENTVVVGTSVSPPVSSLSDGTRAYVKIGEFSVTPDQAGSVTTYDWTDLVDGSNFSVFAAGTTDQLFDDSISASTFSSSSSFSVSVPEPGSIAVLTMFGCGAVIRRRRR